MKSALLDTNFILTCIKQKIDFFEELEFMGFEILIPDKVIDELKKLKQTSALKLLEKSNFKKISLTGKNTDNSIINYAKENPEIFVATLDKELQKKLKNKSPRDHPKGRKIIIRGKKKLEVV
ncbi:hypothetical protein HYS72_02385 [Candidatus Pacearchaeota archaeon]|nr:hypothetical protein [Candidatus Pacearchaeota archaeon]MBI2057176.1 hypothetical protein [Candidatus Pacearchaeota archaeon]